MAIICLDLYRLAGLHASTIMAGVRPEHLTGPTPCAEWSVQDLIDHLVGWTGYGLPQPPVGSRASRLQRPRTPVARFAAVLDALARPGASKRRCLSPLGFDWNRQQALAGTFMDVLIHTWDLATATGQDAPLDPQLVETCWPCSSLRCPNGPPRRSRRPGGPGTRRRPGPGSAPRRAGTPAVSATSPLDPTPSRAESTRVAGARPPRRRAMLRLVCDAERTVSELADQRDVPPTPAVASSSYAMPASSPCGSTSNRRLTESTSPGSPKSAPSSTSSGPPPRRAQGHRRVHAADPSPRRNTA